jgi:hypothetical protein
VTEGVESNGGDESDGDDGNDDHDGKGDDENFDDIDDLDDVPKNMEIDTSSKGGENDPRGDKNPRTSTASNRNVRTADLGNHESVMDNQTPELISHLYEAREQEQVDSDSEQMLRRVSSWRT